jgi:uncharacterized protein (TIGR03000 family)
MWRNLASLALIPLGSMLLSAQPASAGCGPWWPCCYPPCCAPCYCVHCYGCYWDCCCCCWVPVDCYCCKAPDHFPSYCYCWIPCYCRCDWVCVKGCYWGGGQNPGPRPGPPGNAPPGQAAPAAGQAKLTVDLPAGAKLVVNDDQTFSVTSGQQIFTAPDLEPGRVYQYTLRAELPRGGPAQVVTRNVTVRAGDQIRIDLRPPEVAVVVKESRESTR